MRPEQLLCSGTTDAFFGLRLRCALRAAWNFWRIDGFEMSKILPSPIQDRDDSEMSGFQRDFGESFANCETKIRYESAGTLRSLSPRTPFTIHERAVGCSRHVHES